MEFKKFMSIWLILTMCVSAVMFVAPHFQKETNIQTTKPTHFSVVWKGFAPHDWGGNNYSNQTSDYYFCINDLAASVLQMNIALRIQNFENRTLWFRIEPYSAPTGWNITAYNIGQINVDTTYDFVYSNLAKAKPSSISQGELIDNVTLAVKAFNDAGLTQFYSQDTFTVRYHFIDRTAPVWNVHIDNFDDGTGQGWGAGGYWDGGGIQLYGIYRSWPCSLRTGSDYHFYKTFDTTGPYNTAYLIFALYHDAGNQISISIGGVNVFVADTNPGGLGSKWYQYTIPLPISVSFQLIINNINGYLDDVYLIKK